MKTKNNTALTAVSMIDPERMADEFGALMDRIGPRFVRREPRERAGSLMLGLLGAVERKNSWTFAEHRGDRTPDGFQHLLSRAKWDADSVRDDVRSYVVDAFGDPGAVLIVDETGDVKKGTQSVGVQRQYTGTAGRIENAQVAVYLTYAGLRGHALIDRALYLPASWTEDSVRCDEAGIPAEGQVFATKPALALRMIVAALDAGAPASWVTGDEVYGNDPALRRALETRGVGYVLAVACSHPITVGTDRLRVDAVAASVPASGWQMRSAGDGTKGRRWYSWASITLGGDDSAAGECTALVRRNDETGELAFYRCRWQRHRCRWQRWCRWRGAGGRSRSRSRRRRARPGSTNTRCVGGARGIGGRRW